MAAEEDQASKTEDPTEKKITDAVKKGQTATSQEVALLFSLLGFTTYIIFSASDLINNISNMLGVIFERAGEINIRTAVDVTNFFTLLSYKLAILLSPLLLILMAGGVLASVIQNEPRLVLDRIAPKASKLSLIKGWVRLFGKDGLVNFLKSVSKLLFCGIIVFTSLYSSPQEFLNGMFQSPSPFWKVASSIIERLLISVCAAMLVITAADFMWSKYSWRAKLKMSKKEIKDEHKQAEGDPILKARMRSVAQNRNRQRMMESIPTATLIIANPTHYAIALRFISDQDEAPVVVAKGQDLIALRIREIAEQNDVPVFEKVELARALHKVVEIDQVIPAEFYAAIAELINIVYKSTPNVTR